MYYGGISYQGFRLITAYIDHKVSVECLTSVWIIIQRQRLSIIMGDPSDLPRVSNAYLTVMPTTTLP